MACRAKLRLYHSPSIARLLQDFQYQELKDTTQQLPTSLLALHTDCVVWQRDQTSACSAEPITQLQGYSQAQHAAQPQHSYLTPGHEFPCIKIPL